MMIFRIASNVEFTEHKSKIPNECLNTVLFGHSICYSTARAAHRCINNFAIYNFGGEAALDLVFFRPLFPSYWKWDKASYTTAIVCDRFWARAQSTGSRRGHQNSLATRQRDKATLSNQIQVRLIIQYLRPTVKFVWITRPIVFRCGVELMRPCTTSLTITTVWCTEVTLFSQSTRRLWRLQLEMVDKQI